MGADAEEAPIDVEAPEPVPQLEQGAALPQVLQGEKETGRMVQRLDSQPLCVNSIVLRNMTDEKNATVVRIGNRAPPGIQVKGKDEGRTERAAEGCRPIIDRLRQ